jgi:hypothetical protein
MTDLDINRRKLLAAIAGTSVATFAGLGYATGDAVRYTKASSENCEDYTLDAEWRETYTRDGETTLFEDTTDSGSGTEPDEPSIIQLGDILPGDRGTVSFKLEADRTNTNASNTVTPTLGLNLTETAENGINNPEREAGDTSENNGELQEYLQVKVWENTGILGFDALGADNLTQDLSEPTIAEGTLEDVAGDLNGESLGEIDATSDGDSVSVTLRWEFTDSGDINETQTDSVTFDLNIGCQ